MATSQKVNIGNVQRLLQLVVEMSRQEGNLKNGKNKERNLPACNRLEKLCRNISPGRILYFSFWLKKNVSYSFIKMFHSFAPKCLHISAANIALVCARGFCSKTYIRAAVSKSLSRKRSVIGFGKYGKVIQPELIFYFN